MRRLTLREVNEQHGGILPPDATFRPDQEADRPAPAVKPKRRGGRGERFAALNAFADFALADLTGAETKTWLILFRDTKAATGTARTGQADIARRAGLEPRTVRRALASLEAKGMVHVVRRGRLNAGPSVYRLHPTGTARGHSTPSTEDAGVLHPRMGPVPRPSLVASGAENIESNPNPP